MNPFGNESSEAVDILSHVFQYLNFVELYSLQKVSPFFYRTIEYLKSVFIKPIFDIGIVSHSKEELANFFQVFLNENLTIPEFTAKDGFYEYKDQLKSISFSFGSNTIHAYRSIVKDFILKKDRYRVFFYPLYCEQKTSLEHGEYSQLDGFIFLKQKRCENSIYSSMPKGCGYCAAVLEYNSDLGSSRKEMEGEFDMPVSTYGKFRAESEERSSVERSILQCLNYISDNSERLLNLDSSLGVKTSLLETIKSIIKEPKDKKVSDMIYHLFKKRHPTRYLLTSEKVRYTARKLNIFNLPNNIQFNLLERIYRAELSKNNVKIQMENHNINVIYENCLNDVPDRNTYEHQTVEIQISIVFDLVMQEVRFITKEMKRYRTKESSNSKCFIC